MTENLRLEEQQLRLARASLVSAARVMVEENTPVPRFWMPSISEIGGRVRWFLEGVGTARASLVDAAVAASRAAAELSAESDDLEGELTESFRGEYAVAQSRRPKS